jgi:trehalose-6-phosphate hydrolase
MKTTNKSWWKKAVVYQIYVKSFKDTTGNGLGDLWGVIEKLDYLKELGVDAIWLTPIYESPQKDNGYDISDYYRINPDYGTMETFEALICKAHRRDIKIIMDLVVNHTSTEHPWFKEASSSRTNPYRDFYIWKDGNNGREPNNWQSKFGGNAWQYDEKTDQYYLHLFDVTQADLNWENPVVRDNVYQMMDFWLKKGIDGFRLDVINLISKDQGFPNDSMENPSADGRRFYTDGPRIHEYLKEMHARVFSQKPDLLLVGEMSSTSIENCVRYSNPQEQELNMVFSFHHLKVDYKDGNKWDVAAFDFMKLKKVLSEWQYGMGQGDGWNALFWCNHDQPRVVSRFGDDRVYHKESAKMLATVIHLLQGTPYIYQGEEIGMTNAYFDSISDYRDIESLNAYHHLKALGKSDAEVLAVLQQKSRDNARIPMQWSDEDHAGFTSGTPWIRVSSGYKQINAADALKDKDSIFYHYQKLAQLRKEYDVIAYGNFELILADHSQIFAYVRRYVNDTLLVISNFYGETVQCTLPHSISTAGTPQLLISNYPDTKTDISMLTLRPFESLAFYIHGSDGDIASEPSK